MNFKIAPEKRKGKKRKRWKEERKGGQKVCESKAYEMQWIRRIEEKKRN